MILWFFGMGEAFYLFWPVCSDCMLRERILGGYGRSGGDAKAQCVKCPIICPDMGNRLR